MNIDPHDFAQYFEQYGNDPEDQDDIRWVIRIMRRDKNPRLLTQDCREAIKMAEKLRASPQEPEERRKTGALIYWFEGGSDETNGLKYDGWTNDLRRNPRRCRPGCLAVDCGNRVYLATGGNYWDGAERWKPVYPKRLRLAL